jgi:hypothetical protein
MVYRQNTLYRILSYGGFVLVVLLLIASSLFDLSTRIAVLLLDGFIFILACVYLHLSSTE